MLHFITHLAVNAKCCMNSNYLTTDYRKKQIIFMIASEENAYYNNIAESDKYRT